jgi:hypothetical protein
MQSSDFSILYLISPALHPRNGLDMWHVVSRIYQGLVVSKDEARAGDNHMRFKPFSCLGY